MHHQYKRADPRNDQRGEADHTSPDCADRCSLTRLNIIAATHSYLFIA